MHPILSDFKKALEIHDDRAVSMILRACDSVLAVYLQRQNYSEINSFTKILHTLGTQYLVHHNSSEAVGKILAPHFELTVKQCLKVRHSSVTTICAKKILAPEDQDTLIMSFARQNRPELAISLLDGPSLNTRWLESGASFLKAFTTVLAAHARVGTHPGKDWLCFAKEHEEDILELSEDLKLGADLAVAAFRFDLKNLLSHARETVVLNPSQKDFEHFRKLEEIGEVFSDERKAILCKEAVERIKFAEENNRGNNPEKISTAVQDQLLKAIQTHDFWKHGDYLLTTGSPKDMWERGEVAEVANYIWGKTKHSNPTAIIALLERDFPTLEEAEEIKNELSEDLYQSLEVVSVRRLEIDLGL